MSVTFNFSGRTVIVVGGTSGINLGIADAFARTGANVAVASRSSEKVDKAVDQLKAHGTTVLGAAFDVRDIDGVKADLQTFHETLGAFDVVVSGAAGNFPAYVKDMSSNAFRSVVEIDLLGSFHVAREAYPHLKKPGASYIHISAPQAFLASQLQSHVSAAKAGVDMLTRSLALEWGSVGIRVNSIIPGPIAGTEGMARLAPTPALKDAVTNSVPLKRDGTPDDIANAAMMLASDAAGYINGTVLPVDGGWHLAGYSAMMMGLADAFAALQKPS